MLGIEENPNLHYTKNQRIRNENFHRILIFFMKEFTIRL